MDAIFESDFFKNFKKPHKASRYNTTSDLSTNKKYNGNISLINVDVKIANKTFNIIPTQGGNLFDLRIDVMKRLEYFLNYELDSELQESFLFYIGKTVIPPPKETLNMEKLFQEIYVSHPNCFNGDVVTVIMKIPSLSLEYQLLKQLLPRFMNQTTIAVFAVRQLISNKEKMKNRVIKYEHNPDYYTINICNVRGELKDSYILRSLIISQNGEINTNEENYYRVKLETNNKREVNEPLIEDICFLSEEERIKFLTTADKLQQIVEDSDGELEKEKSASGENLDKEILEIIAEVSLKKEDSNTQGNEINLKRGISQEANDGIANLHLKRSETIEESKSTALGNLTLRRGKSEIRPAETEIQKTLREKHQLHLDKYEYPVKIHGTFGLKHKRILRINNDFEFMLLKKEKVGDSEIETYNYISHMPMYDILKIKPREGDNSKVEFIFRDEKKYAKTLKVDFDHPKDGDGFMELIKRIAKLFTYSSNSFKTEKEQKEHDKTYSWLIGPKHEQSNVEFENGELKAIQFKVVNISNFGEPQIVHINLVNSILSLMLADGTIEKKIGLKDILYCETDLRDPRGLNLILRNKHISLLFSDNRSRLLFEAAVYETGMPQYKLTQKKIFEPEKLKVYCTTFNCGNAPPAKDLNLWLQKSKESHIIAIALQECDTAEWLEAIQSYYGGEKFALITLVTMWRMLLCVFVKSEYAPYVNSIDSGNKPTGIADLLGNKGGLAIGFKILETSFCFMGCHLAAHPEKMPLRKANFYNLMKYLRISDDKIEMPATFDYFFFMGDANFRLDCDFYFALNAINNGEHESLISFDQLIRSKKNDNFMTIFQEGELKFKPSYRRNREDTGYSNKNNQAPSWTDRVLVKSRPGRNADLLIYDSDEMFFLSDHRPVYAIYECKADPPYLPRKPLYLRDPNYLGVIKFLDLSLTYNYYLHEQMTDIEEPFFWPLHITIHFRARFLGKYSTTFPLELKAIPSVVTWDQKMIPLLYCIIPDLQYLKNNSILGIIKAKREDESELLMGQVDIPLNTLMENQGAKTEFKIQVYLYGRVFGTFKGTFVYELQ